MQAVLLFVKRPLHKARGVQQHEVGKQSAEKVLLPSSPGHPRGWDGTDLLTHPPASCWDLYFRWSKNETHLLWSTAGCSEMNFVWWQGQQETTLLLRFLMPSEETSLFPYTPLPLSSLKKYNLWCVSFLKHAQCFLRHLNHFVAY